MNCLAVKVKKLFLLSKKNHLGSLKTYDIKNSCIESIGGFLSPNPHFFFLIGKNGCFVHHELN